MEKFEDNDDKKKIATSKTLYKNLPVYFTCPHCDYTGYTIVEQKTTYISYILMILFIFIFGVFFSIILMPLVILLTRSFFHKCPSCFKDVGSDNKILSILDLQDKMISFNVGEFGIVLTRKIVLGIFLSIVLIFTIYLKLDFNGHHHHHGEIRPVNVTWNDFLEECGREAFEQYGVERVIQCKKKYSERTVMNWRGYVARIEDIRRGFTSYFVPHAIIILVKMMPEESEFAVEISMAVDSHLAKDYNDILLNLNRGSEIIFNATVLTFGEDLKLRHFHLVDIQAGKGSIEIPEATLYSDGRYSDFVKPKFLRIASLVINNNNNRLPAPEPVEKKEDTDAVDGNSN